MFGGVLMNPFVCLFVCCPPSERQVFLATWKDIPNENELQYQIKECHLNAGKNSLRSLQLHLQFGRNPSVGHFIIIQLCILPICT